MLVADAEKKVWWRNVREPAPVEVRLKGRTLAGHAEAVPDHEQLVALYRDRNPRAAAALTATLRIGPGGSASSGRQARGATPTEAPGDAAPAAGR